MVHCCDVTSEPASAFSTPELRGVVGELHRQGQGADPEV